MKAEAPNSKNTRVDALSTWQQASLILISVLLVALGQPARCWWCGLIAAAAGFALFWRFLLSINKPSERFWMATGWAFIVEITHSSWFIAHPFIYIYGVWIILSFGCALQFGLVSLLITHRRVIHLPSLAVIAAIWTLMEWARLFLMSGYSLNPFGLALTGHIYPMQMASLWGVYGMTFWIIFVNLLLLRAWILWKETSYRYVAFSLWMIAASVPYFYGYVHYSYHANAFAQEQATNPKNMSVVLVQPAFLPEEAIQYRDPQGAITHVINEWRQILTIMSKHLGEKNDLIALPEFVVPYGTYTPIYPADTIIALFKEILGEESLKGLPPMDDPWAAEIQTKTGMRWYVDNAFIAQALSTIFQAEVVVGLEDVEFAPDINAGKKLNFYSAAICFHPNMEIEERYEKRVLVPMAEYIPFTFCKEIAATYGISGSFTPGKEARIFQSAGIPFGCCICYEETFGHLMRESRLLGAQVLVNVTSDVWFPNSRLPQQHFDHARLRTVENGIPLVRACNTGITCAVDSLGRVVDSLGKEGENEWISDSIRIQVPLYHYQTIYSSYGDKPLIGFCFIALFSWLGIGYIRKRY